MTKKAQALPTKIDHRKLPLDQRGEPHTGQSADPFERGVEDLTSDEARLVGVLFSAGTPLKIRDIAKAKRKPDLWVRNTLRRLVPSGWIERVARGEYKLTTKGKRRADAL